MDEDPRPVLYVGPTEKNVLSMSSDRVTKMIASCPDLNNAHEKGHKDKTGEKWINSCRLGFAWAGSPTELASHPAAKVLIDERDRMGETREGDVDSILGEAVATYSGIVIRVSTPLLGDAVRHWDEEVDRDYWKIADPDDLSSPIWTLWQEGTRHEWNVSCPHCDSYFAPHLDLLRWDDELPIEEIADSACLVCPHCGTEIENHDKDTMNDRGVFVAPDEIIEPYTKGAKGALIDGKLVGFGSYLNKDKKDITFWISGLNSPWRSYGQRAVALKKAKDSKSDAREQGIVNTLFGQVFKPKGQAPEWTLLKSLQQGYNRLEIPDRVQVLTAGVDVHAKRLNYVIRGWGPGYESYLIDYGELFGECKYLDDISWRQLRDILMDTYGEKNLTIPLMLIDAGYKPNDEPAPANVIYQFCHANKRAKPTKGHDTRSRAYSASNIELEYKGKPVKGGLQLWHLDTNFFKDFIYSRYEWEEDKAGGWYLPADVEDEYLRQATSESKIVLSSGSPKWEKIRHANHYLDSEMNATAAAHILRLHRLQEEEASKNPQPKTRRRSRKSYKG